MPPVPGVGDSLEVATLEGVLFRAVALESGGGRDSPSVADTKPVYADYIRSLNCSLDDALDCLRDASVTTLNQTTISLDTSGGNVLVQILSSKGTALETPGWPWWMATLSLRILLL